jgi:hypothetical protein
MNKDELYEILDIENGKEFQYFENIADLFESSEDIGGDIIFELLKEIDLDVFAELCENYFDQLEDWIPDGETDFFMLITNIKRVMIGMAQSISSDDSEESDDSEDTLLQLSDEIGKFRVWYSDSDNVECVNDETEEVTELPVRDALALCREEKLGGATYRFDFSDALDYELSDFIMTFADLADID